MPGGTLPTTWTKISKRPQDRGIYKAPNGSIRVMYQSRERQPGGAIKTVQRVKTFWRGFYTISDPSGASKRVTEMAAARDFKQRQDLARKTGAARDVAAETMTLAEYYARWLERPSGRTGQPRRETTRARIEAAWSKHIAPAFGERPIGSITISDVADWHANLTGDRNKSMRVLRAILAGAVREQLAATNVAADSGISATDRVRTITRDEVLSEEQVASLGQAVPQQYRLAIELLACGMRIGEVFGLRRSAINLKGDVKVERQLAEVNGRLVEGPPKSMNGYRTLPLRHLAEDIQHHLARFSQQDADGFVFTSPTGHVPVIPSNWRDRVFYPALRAAGLPESITPHVLRHRIACTLADEGYSDTQIASWLGDDARTVAKVYRNLLVDTNMRIGEHLASRRAFQSSSE